MVWFFFYGYTLHSLRVPTSFNSAQICNFFYEWCFNCSVVGGGIGVFYSLLFVFFVFFLSNFIHLTSPFHLLSITPCRCHFWHHSLSLNPVLGTTKFWPVFSFLVFVLNFLTLMMILFVFYLIHLESYSLLFLKVPLLFSPHSQAMKILPSDPGCVNHLWFRLFPLLVLQFFGRRISGEIQAHTANLVFQAYKSLRSEGEQRR